MSMLEDLHGSLPKPHKLSEVSCLHSNVYSADFHARVRMLAGIICEHTIQSEVMQNLAALSYILEQSDADHTTNDSSKSAVWTYLQYLAEKSSPYAATQDNKSHLTNHSDLSLSSDAFKQRNSHTEDNGLSRSALQACPCPTGSVVINSSRDIATTGAKLSVGLDDSSEPEELTELSTKLNNATSRKYHTLVRAADHGDDLGQTVRSIIHELFVRGHSSSKSALVQAGSLICSLFDYDALEHISFSWRSLMNVDGGSMEGVEFTKAGIEQAPNLALTSAVSSLTIFTQLYISLGIAYQSYINTSGVALHEHIMLNARIMDYMRYKAELMRALTEERLDPEQIANILDRELSTVFQAKDKVKRGHRRRDAIASFLKMLAECQNFDKFKQFQAYAYILHAFSKVLGHGTLAIFNETTKRKLIHRVPASQIITSVLQDVAERTNVVRLATFLDHFLVEPTIRHGTPCSAENLSEGALHVWMDALKTGECSGIASRLELENADSIL